MTAAVHVSSPSQLIKDAKSNWARYCCEFDLDDPEVIVNNSGGKDSGATNLLALEITQGNYRSVAADTGNEHHLTIEHLQTLHQQTGGKPVEIVSAKYPQAMFDKRKAKVEKQWVKKQKVMAGEYRGLIMPSLTRADTKFAEAWRVASRSLGWGEYETPIEAFRDSFVRSGNPFLDMSLLHGGFPLGRQRFCTDELKMQLVLDKVLTPRIEAGKEVVQWSGVRADESDKRAGYPMFEEDKRCETGQLYNFLPIHQWSAADVFSVYKYFGVKPNPLYKHGMARVGCMPCILVNKEELAEIAARFPEELERVGRWEKQVAKVSRWIHWMIVSHIDRRQFKKSIKVEIEGKLRTRSKFIKMGKSLMFNPQHVLGIEAYKGTSMLGPRGGVIGGTVNDAIDWSKTGKGGKVYDLVTAAINAEACSSRYGLCE